MSEPPRIQGPGSPQDPLGSKKDKTVGANDFKKYMVEEIKETDADKRRNRKRREEGEEETDEEKKAIGASPPSAVPLSTGEDSPLKAGSGTTSRYVSSKETPPSSAPPTPMKSFKADEIEEYAWEDEEKAQAQPPPPQRSYAEAPPPPAESSEEIWAPEIEDLPTPAPQRYFSEDYGPNKAEDWGESTPPAPVPQQWERAETEKEEGAKIAPAESTKSKKTPPKKKEPSHMLAKEEKRRKGQSSDFKSHMEESTAPKEKKRRAAKKTAAGAKPPLSEAKLKEKEAISPQEPAPLGLKGEGKAPSGGSLPSTKRESTDKIPLKKTEAHREEEVEGGIPGLPITQPAPQGETGGEREQREMDESLKEPVAGPAMEGVSSGVILPTAAPLLASVSPYADIHSDILALFERMVGVLTVMKTAGITETTLLLGEKTFAGTVLGGTSITIREYDFAAGELNLEFTGSPQAVALLQQNLPSLANALKKRGLIVKRTEFVFSRKRPVSDSGNSEQQEEHEK